MSQHTIADVETLLEGMTQQLRSHLKTHQLDEPLMIGIHTGGVWVAEQLHQRLGLQQPLGTLDISFYRDDFSRIGMNPEVKPSNLPFDVEDRTIILVDDVLQTGRTIRAALNEIFDYGRPARVILAALLERSGHELPIRADITGERIELAADEQVKLTGPDNMSLSIQSSHE
ncbi:MAG: bifunctional pyr operon transcriptional regulator/uracil phosphoribosyltransferase PyrR [Pseudomonadota bacterium]